MDSCILNWHDVNLPVELLCNRAALGLTHHDCVSGLKKIAASQTSQGAKVMFGVKSFTSGSHKNFYVSGASSPDKPLKSVIVGDNAAGKTRFIVSVIDAFRLLHQARSGGGPRKLSNRRKDLTSTSGDLRLCYYTSAGFVDAQVDSTTLKVTLDGGHTFPGEIPLPARIIAISSAYNDKFPFSTNDEELEGDFYKYCGLRETSNASWSATLARKTIENLLMMDTLGAAVPIEALFDQLGLQTKFRISLSATSKRKFSEALSSPDALLEYIHNYSNYQRRMQVDMFTSTSKKDVMSIFEGYKHLRQQTDKSHYFDIDLKSDGRGHSEIYDFLNIVRRVGLIKDVHLELFRVGAYESYAFSNASSGETQLLYGFSSILRYACDDSIIFIDEPEVSLHPAWQIRYVGLLKKALVAVKNCHLIIATHSHFILSDLDEANSSLHIFKKEKDGGISIENLEYSTYAWSPENILYSVFNVRTIGNHAFEKDLQEALNLIAVKDSDLVRLSVLASKFQGLVFDSSDPLNKVIGAIRGYSDGHH